MLCLWLGNTSRRHTTGQWAPRTLAGFSRLLTGPLMPSTRPSILVASARAVRCHPMFWLLCFLRREAKDWTMCLLQQAQSLPGLPALPLFTVLFLFYDDPVPGASCHWLTGSLGGFVLVAVDPQNLINRGASTFPPVTRPEISLVSFHCLRS